MKIEASITKDAINTLPICDFVGKIVIVNSTEGMLQAIDHLKEAKVLGFDTETKPAFAKGVFNKVALLQIANADTCYLFRLNKLGFPIELERLLKNKKIKKIGVSLHDDFSALSKRKIFNPESFIDLQKIVHQYGIADLSLQKIYAILFGQKISKSQRLSNWEAEELTESQQRYAALDAWAPLQIYTKLQEMNPIVK
jgi:ribonuclease D